MRLGVVLPQMELGAEPAVIREYAETSEAAGYDHLIAYDHVLGWIRIGRSGQWGRIRARRCFTNRWCYSGS